MITNSIIDISYDTSITDKEFIKNTKGIFSFSVYTSPNQFDKNVNQLSNLNISGVGRFSKLYMIGLLSYLSLAQKDDWKGWRVIIHTDEETLQGNPITFEKFKQMGAIIGITKLKGEFSDLSKYRGIFRINRYYPLFLKELNIPILIRDADTIFESYVSEQLQNKLINIKQKNRTAKLKVNSNDFILDDFINKLNNWEKLYFNKISKFNNKIIFSYDDQYEIPLNKNANLSKLKWSGEEKNKSIYSGKVRFFSWHII